MIAKKRKSHLKKLRDASFDEEEKQKPDVGQIENAMIRARENSELS